jgi:hypothetical protein
MSAPAEHFLLQQADVGAQKKRKPKIVCSNSTGKADHVHLLIALPRQLGLSIFCRR